MSGSTSGRREPAPVEFVELDELPGRSPAPEGSRRCRVATVSGTVYDLDPVAMTATRTSPVSAAPLRRDGEPLALWSWPHVEVGRSMLLVISVREDSGAPTFRTSTPVASVLQA